MALNFYNITEILPKYYKKFTEILKLYYNLVKILDNIEKKNKILIYKERLKLAKWE